MKVIPLTLQRWPVLHKIALAATANLIGTALFGTAAFAAPPIYVDGTKIAVPAIERNNHVFVPIRGVFEKLDTAVEYAPPRSVIARKGNSDVVKLTLGSRTANVNGTARTLDTAPFKSSSHVFVPLRLLSEAAGATVAYSAATHAVTIVHARAIVAAAPPVVVAATPVQAVVPATQQQGVPWWLWLLLALIALAIVFALIRRRKPEPVIKTRSSAGDPTIRTRR